MHVLITGGAGFIGSHLTEQFLAAGHQVTAIDNLATGSLDNVRHLLEDPSYELVTDSVLNEGLMEYLIRRCDVVYHLAAAVGVRWFIEQALRGEPLTVYGDGQQTRCFTDVRDSVAAMIRLMETPAAFGQVFNIGNRREITIQELARTVIRLTGSSSTIRQVPYEQAY